MSPCDIVHLHRLLRPTTDGRAVKLVTQAALDTVSMESTFYALDAVGELVFVRNVKCKEPWWPVCVQCCLAAGRVGEISMLNSTFTFT